MCQELRPTWMRYWLVRWLMGRASPPRRRI
nr:MAG TPA: hypothetical protein [Caudoviricetes sp.]